MNETIGQTAGKVWEYLSEQGESTITNLKKELSLKADEASMALGWLAREDKLDFVKKGAKNLIKLR